ncbi:ribbon-helix-helix protein, CopG family [Candidatus Gottesmanbacteria bacterium]|nr:ribbon-helix-helix protein, CopG family [Candidatus Gottesmanbacteria bacterium]
MIGNQMIATTIYMPRDLYAQVGKAARKQGQPKARIIRDLVADGLTKQRRDPDATRKFVSALKSMQFRGGVRDAAKRHDHYTWD